MRDEAIWAVPPGTKRRCESGQHRAIKNSHYGVSYTLSGVDIPEVLTNGNLDDEVPKCKDNFGGKGSKKHDSPYIVPGQPGQGAEKYRIKEIAGRVKC